MMYGRGRRRVLCTSLHAGASAGFSLVLVHAISIQGTCWAFLIFELFEQFFYYIVQCRINVVSLQANAEVGLELFVPHCVREINQILEGEVK